MKTILGTIAIALILCSCGGTTQDKTEKSAPLEQTTADTLTAEPLKKDTFDRNKSEMDSMDSLLKTK